MRSLRTHGPLLRAAIVWLALLVPGAGPALAQGTVSAGPSLRIETGAHTAKINDAAVDAAGTVLVTASYDKTARIWSLPDLHPFGVLRPPIGPDREGLIYAVAVSPDARLAAIGGWGRQNDNDVLVVDLQTRQVVQRFPGLPNVINVLAFSADGARLAAGVRASNGIRIWSMSDGRLLWEDRDYGDAVNGIAFAADGRLATTSADGGIRLYGPGGRLIRRVETTAGALPFRPRFDPTGSLLAISYDDTLALEVRDGTTLEVGAQPDISGLLGQNLASVGWSADGTTLFAGGDASLAGTRPLFAWGDSGRGPRRVVMTGLVDVPASIHALPDGRLVDVTTSGNIAVLGPDGKTAGERFRGAGDLNTLVDRTGPTASFRVSADGTAVEWVYYGAQDRRLRFDARRDELAVGSPPQPGMTDWAAQTAGSRVTDWVNRPDPKLNGKVLGLNPYELARSVSAAPGKLLVGGDWYLRLFGPAGESLWPKPISLPDVAWRVNQSADGRLAVAGLGDGTIRWYRLSDGQELLALFVTPDAKRWVAFSPSGYYIAGPGGEDLIGWQVNNGPDRLADFFPASRFRERFYRPDVIGRVLDTLDEAEAVRQGDAAQAAARGANAARLAPTLDALKQEILKDRPPVVTILSPREDLQLSGDMAEIDAEVRSPTGRAITRVEVRIDGRPAQGVQVGAAQPFVPPTGGTAERRHLTVPVPLGQDLTLQVIAWSTDRASEPAVVRVRARPAPVPELSKPRLNAVLIGVSAYEDPDLKLKFAAKDADDFAKVLRRQGGPDGLYREVNVHVVPEAKATRETILREIQWMQRETTQRDLAILFLAGHGVSEDVEYYFLPVDADQDSAPVRGLSGTDLRRTLRLIPGRTIALLDTCYAGALVGNGTGFRSPPPDLTKLVNELSSADTGVAVYSATTGHQRAQERADLGNGVFTRALLDVIGGKDNASGDAVLRLNRLAELLAEDVKSLTGGRQASTYNALAPLPDLPLFLVRK